MLGSRRSARCGDRRGRGPGRVGSDGDRDDGSDIDPVIDPDIDSDHDRRIGQDDGDESSTGHRRARRPYLREGAARVDLARPSSECGVAGLPDRRRLGQALRRQRRKGEGDRAGVRGLLPRRAHGLRVRWGRGDPRPERPGVRRTEGRRGARGVPLPLRLRGIDRRPALRQAAECRRAARDRVGSRTTPHQARRAPCGHCRRRHEQGRQGLRGCRPLTGWHDQRQPVRFRRARSRERNLRRPHVDDRVFACVRRR